MARPKGILSRPDITVSIIIEYHNKGYSLEKIAKTLNCSISLLSLRLSKENIHLTRDDVKIEEIQKYHKLGYSLRQIGKILNCDSSVIRYKANKHNIKFTNKKKYICKYKIGYKNQAFEIIDFDFKTISKNGHVKYFKCKCNLCGTISTKSVSDINKNKSCSRKCIDKSGSNNPAWRGVGELSQNKFGLIERQAKSRNIPFNLTIEFLWQLYQKQNGTCAISGIFISLPKKYKQLGTASLDRIDSSIGYIESNVQWVHKDINISKHKLSQDKFIEYCKIITDYQQSKNKE